MPTDTTVNALVINKLTKAQYDEIQNPSPTELYLVPDEIDNVPTSGSDNSVKSGGIYTALEEKQDTIDSSHKLSADLVDDSSSTNKFTNTTEKTTWNNKQETLVSGTNIKTINNESILGSGNITIQGGGSAAAYTPTLQSAPTSSTTTYTKDGSTVDFEIGQFCRVLNQGSYDFYQLYDLTTSNNVTTATWMPDVHDVIGDINTILDNINGEVI